MKNYIAIADVHGELSMLERALQDCEDWIYRNESGWPTQFVFLGDYIDRGPKSKEVIQLVKKYVLEQDAVCLIGNHDLFMIGTAEVTDVIFEDMRYVSNTRLWDNNGGLKTCREMFGIQLDQHMLPVEDVAPYRKKILESDEYKFLKEYGKFKYETESIFFSHAAQSDVKDINEMTLTWSRRADFDHPNGDRVFKVPSNKVMSVHGHYHKLPELNFPRIINYMHGGLLRTVVMADSGCGCGNNGKLHPIIIRETSTSKSGAEIVAIL